MNAVIFANGTFDRPPDFSTLLKGADLFIAADGGANHCAEIGITPDILLGDLDSIKPGLLTQYENEGIEIIRYPRKKDATDLELALDLAMERGAQTIRLLGVLGGRWDMSLANIMLAAGGKYKHCTIYLLDQDCSMQILHPGKIHTLSATRGQKASFLPLKGDIHGVTLSGFEYPLTNHTISFGSSLGVSNIFLGKTATVYLAKGTLLAVLFDEK